ncbi:MAG: glycoside hydrolase family 25 [Clostridia bacterium]|nr:glycoside hydrolase family 25 [Clostridia bacterium]
MGKRIAVLVGAALLLALALSIYDGLIQLNHPSKADHPIRGVDVSHYQGTIDWETLQEQGIRFAYIKATEGSSYVDGMFGRNWENIARTDLRYGAYHFFSFGSSGQTQAENFCGTVRAAEGMLPPAVDVEPYGKYRSAEDLRNAQDELSAWLETVEARMGVRPIIYTTEDFYRECVSDSFPEHDIWIRSVYRSPSKDIAWTFWQYSNRFQLKGYSGEERFIDMNAFIGDVEAFEAYGLGRTDRSSD